jgi:hypothetical protein
VDYAWWAADPREKQLTDRIQAFFEALWKLEPPGGQWRYHDGLLAFMAFLHASGSFRIYR